MANVRVIPATAPARSAQTVSTDARRRVAAYARVSTDSEEQQTSYEAQVDYYTKLIEKRSDWELADVYTDEGISAVSTKRREGFNKMIDDALSGNIDLIVTKSVSRFARNTVDSLTTVRKLKEKGIEVWFEKENIYTLDSKGELLITIMSSLAQEESRSISENVTWGHRKRMADGKVTLPYGQFLGYEKGEDGLPQIVSEEARIVRLIFRQFLEGMTFSAIASALSKGGILTPAGKTVWQPATVQSILTNEKYKGDALLQKTFCEDFLTKKMVRNAGQVPQYYVENSHPAIIEPDEFDAVQLEIQRRGKLGRPKSCGSPFSVKLVCGDCGGFYGSKVWGSNTQYRRTIWQCNDKYKGDTKCETPHLTEDEIKSRFLTAFNTLMANRDGLIEDCHLAKKLLTDTSKIDAELIEVRNEIEVVTELSRKAISENASTAIDQEAFHERNNSYLDRHRLASAQIDKLEAEKKERLGKAKLLDGFIRDIQSRPLILDEFDERLWAAVVDKVTVAKDGGMVFLFRNGTAIQW